MALTDELVSHGELMSTLLFVEILRERNIQAQWFDVRKVMRTSDRFGCANRISQRCRSWPRYSLPHAWQRVWSSPRALSAAKAKAAQRRWDAAAATTRRRCLQKRCTRRASISGRMCRASTPPTRAWCLPRSVSMKSPLKKRRKWRPLARRCCTLQRCCPPYAAISRFSFGSSKDQKRAGRWYAIKPKTHRSSARWRCVANRRC